MERATAAAIMTDAHRDSVKAPLDVVARSLQEVLSGRLTAYIAGVESTKSVSRWASAEVTQTQDLETDQRLRAAYKILRILLDGDSASTVKAWFIGLNPELGDISPAQALRTGRAPEAIAAALAFRIGG